MKKRIRWIIIIISLAIFLANVLPTRNVSALPDHEAKIINEVSSHIPMSLEMVDSAVEVLSKGLNGMTPEEIEQFERIFDPSDSGTIDQEYVDDVLENYGKIRSRLEGSISFEYTEDSEMCEGQRLYHTDFITIKICPYFNTESDSVRKTRVLVHEVAHIALKAKDRPYYDPKSYSSSYNSLMPRGSWATQLPAVGLIFREISLGDTLYHPDAYAWFASLNYSELSYER